MTDYLEVNDLTVRGNFKFFKNYLSFTGKTSINTVQDVCTGAGNLTATNDYQLEIKLSPLTNILLTQLGNGSITAEGEYNVWQDDKKEHNVSIYKHCRIDENFLVTNTTQLLYNFKNIYLLNLGMRGLELYSYNNKRLDPGLFSVGGMTKIYEDKNITTWGGVHMNLKPKNIDNVTILLGMSNKSLNGVLKLNIERKENIGLDTFSSQSTCKTIENPLGNVMIAKPYRYENELRIAFESRVQDDLSIFSTMTVKQDQHAKLVPSFVGGGMYVIDADTNLRFKANDDMVATLSLTKRLKNMVDFTFATNFIYKTAFKDKKIGSIKTKFGLSINFLEEFVN